MGTPQSRPLELIHEKFARTLSSGDTECALDLLAVAALAAAHTPAQTERLQLLHLARTGIIRAEGADIRRDPDFEVAALRLIVDAAVPLAYALAPEVGASMARRRGWIDAWHQLAWFHPLASNAGAVAKFYRALDGYLDDPSDEQAVFGFAALANQVEQGFADEGLVARAPGTEGIPTRPGSPGFAESEGSFEDPRLIDEFESFLEGRETSQALNLLAVAVLYAEYVGLSRDDQTLLELLARSAGLVGDAWDDSTELSGLLSRLWVTAYIQLAEQFEDERLEDLGLPEFESEFPPLDDTQQRVWQSSTEDYEARKALEATHAEDHDPEDDASEHDGELVGDSNEVTGLTEGNSSMDLQERLMAVALDIVTEEYSDVVHRGISRIYIGGVPEYVLVVNVSDVVGWLRSKDGGCVWRDGNFATGDAWDAVPVENPEVDQSDLREALGEFIIHADESQWPPPQPAVGEAEEFVRSIENGQKPPVWSHAHDKSVQSTPLRRPDPASAPAERTVPPAAAAPSAHVEPVEFNAYIHDSERNPPAPGFTEKDLEGVPLITVYPAVIPAVVGGLFLFLGFMGAQYEFYVVLRWAVTSMAIWTCVVASGQRRGGWTVVFTGVALLFNPLIPVIATREFWILPDLVGAAIFATAGRKLRASRPATHKDKASF
ncbi:hypothetical protein J2W14_002355 [Pseudarthrobacter oxydans]|uniref:DUF6804 family protein n=1 Tax=Pseudarthrobacter oxydans TaxID=1671 RepID=UPI00277F759C|nr:DUF6804 family protein [Pseudarthrobacter oxydans]MDP9982953.1 hypothetical protein [Pseudarthrobacter oxydans]